MTLWPQPRRRVLAIIVLVTAATVAYGIALGGDDVPWFPAVAAAYLVATAVAAGSPPAIGVQVAAGFGLVWSALQGLQGAAVLALVPLVVGVVATAELLGLLAMVVERTTRPDLRRLTVTVSVTTVISAVTLSAGLLDLPGGLMGIVLAAGACVVLAVLLVGGQSNRVS